MNKAYLMMLVAGLSFSTGTAVQAANLEMDLASETAERPLIQLEETLLPEGIMTLRSPDAESQNLSTQEIANALVRGLLVANRTREIGYTHPLSYRVQNVVRRLRWGDPLNVARSRAGIPQITINRLLALGQRTGSDVSMAMVNPRPATDILESHGFANSIIRGLLVANRTGEIGYNALLSYRVQDVVRRLRRGEPLEVAGNRSRVSTATLTRLMELGQIRSARKLD